MDQARMFVVFAVILSMIFTLAALHRYSRQPADQGPLPVSPSFGSPSRPGEAGSDTPGTPGAAGGDQGWAPMIPPPDFCFGTSSPEEAEKNFRDGADRMQPPPPPEGGSAVVKD